MLIHVVITWLGLDEVALGTSLTLSPFDHSPELPPLIFLPRYA